MKQFITLLFSLTAVSFIYSQSYKVVESTIDHIKLEVNYPQNASIKNKVINGNKFSYIDTKDYAYRRPGEPWLPSESFIIGVPFDKKINVKIQNLISENIKNISILPFPDSVNQKPDDLNYDQKVYNSNKKFPESIVANTTSIMRYAKIGSFEISPYQYNPVTRELTYNRKFTIEIKFENNNSAVVNISKINDPFTEDFIKSSVLNPEEAKEFIGKIELPNDNPFLADTFWYSPSKDFYKILLKEKGIYRVTYQKLISSGAPASGLAPGNFELYNMGKRVPIEIVDADSNGVFNSGDYFNFIGTPPPPHDAYTYLNIYNFSNVYWFSYQADSIKTYKSIDGFPTNFDNTIRYSIKTIHYEQDLLYERLGHAVNDQRDYWLWGKAEARSFEPYENFLFWMQDSLVYNIYPSITQATVRINLQGITDFSCTNGYGHHALVKLNTNIIGNVYFNGQNSITTSHNFNFSVNGSQGIPLYLENKFEVEMKGDVCSDGSDEIRVNWFEIDYFRMNNIKAKKFQFNSPPQFIGKNTYGFFNWYSDNAKIYIPSREEIIKNPWIRNDADKSLYFKDSIGIGTEYFIYANESFLEPDTIIKDAISDLHNIAQGADYIIITHPLFKSVAQRLANLRSNSVPGITNPRIKIIDVNDIYDEFSFGLLDPFSLKLFVKYAFEKWQSPAPAYIVLLGDMSYDYRPIYPWPGNRPNFVPSIPFHAFTFGQAPSDNLIVDIAGDDLIPDLAIGRISCETVEEGNILIDKLANYPGDNGKEWKQNILLMASGIDELDELTFGFNDKSMDLENMFLNQNGFHSSKVFRFPNKPEYVPFQGGGPKIREEFNKGAVLANYYGHGGGGQWDLTFTNDDIYQLNNQNRMPLVISVTCYTAHYDNQTIFGEIFNRVPGKGSIAFYGSSGLTWWQAGTYINELFFDEVFNKKVYNVGKAILNSKLRASTSSYVLSQITLLHLLGDPALELALPKTPDFVIKSNDITFSPPNPIKGDTVSFNVNLKNLGISFQDSVRVTAYHKFIDTANVIFDGKIASFGENSSFNFKWITSKAGLFNIIIVINEDEQIYETDISDNKAITNVPVFDFSEPSIVKPLNGSVYKGKFNFNIVDIGNIIQRDFKYRFIIDTSSTLDSPSKIVSPILSPKSGFIKWESPQLSPNNYYWRAYIFDGVDTNKSKLFSLTVSPSFNEGYYTGGRLLKDLENYNMVYNYSNQSLQVNNELLKPRPSDSQFLDSMRIKLPADTAGLTGITSDGSYYFFTHLPPYVRNNPTTIYKVGTGQNGTIRGKVEGPLPNTYPISNSIFYFKDGYLYAPARDGISLYKIDRVTGDSSRVTLADSLIPSLDGLLPDSSSYYLSTDGRYLYNLSAGYGQNRQRYILRKFDPENNWSKSGNDVVFAGTSPTGFSGFFVVGDKLYTYESRVSGYMRSYSITNATFEEEWAPYTPYFIYTLTYDWVNNFVIGSTFKPVIATYTPAFYKFKGTYKDAKAYLFSNEIGPAYKWKSINYNIDTVGSLGHYNSFLMALNSQTNAWDTIKTSVNPSTSITDLNAKKYPFIKLGMNLVDSSYGVSEPLELKSINAEFNGYPEITINRKDIVFTPDTLMQGFNTELAVQVFNLGDSEADSVSFKYFSNDSDSAFITNSNIVIPKDSSVTIKNTINTSLWPPATLYETKIIIDGDFEEPYSFNNIARSSFFVSRDSLNPIFKVTFDDKEISNGEIISAKPKIVITLQDNSPLAIDTTMFTLVLDGTQVYFSRSDIKFTSSGYPNTQGKIEWNPTLKDGKHALDMLAKDASGNFFDTTTHRIEFYVFNETDLKNVFNFPNPFKNDTYFTFELHGQQIPDEFNIKIYTVAGRLIKDINVIPSVLRVGFNRLYWDGKDQDGDEVANGVYFYKIVSKTNGVIKTATEKLAKVK